MSARPLLSKPDQFLVSHALASTVVIAGSVCCTFVLYFVLLVIAAVTGGGPGGPLALPFLLLVAFVLSASAVALIFWPATLLGGYLARRVHRSTLLEILFVTLLAMALAVGLGGLVGWKQGEPMGGFQIGSLGAFGLLIPLGLYWWSLRATDLILAVLVRLLRRGRSADH